MDEYLIKLGNEIAKKRKRKKMSQEKLAELSDVHRTYIGSIEKGKYNPTILKLRNIATALGCTVDNLLKKLE